jgi:hypothetical protein
MDEDQSMQSAEKGSEGSPRSTPALHEVYPLLGPTPEATLNALCLLAECKDMNYTALDESPAKQ